MRSSRVNSRAACALALTLTVVGGADTSAHRRDEYLQAARIAIDPGAVQVELDLTPGIELAEVIIADIDRNRDGTLSGDEQRTYANVVLSALEVEVDGNVVRLALSDSSYPDNDAMRRGEGAIRLQAATTLAGLSVGAHRLVFRNRHHPDGSVYLANALVPQSDRVAVTAQSRDGDHRELVIDYDVRAAGATSARVWLLGSIAVAAALFALLKRQSPPFRSVRTTTSAASRASR